MKRNEFFKKGLLSLGGVVALGGIAAPRAGNTLYPDAGSSDCDTSPRETKGPFPNRTPAEYVRSSIIGDRKGVALLINLTIVDKNQGCQPISGAFVDIWHCDGQGNYSEYGGFGAQNDDLKENHFLRGRQATDIYGRVSFISIFPGYYRGRAPHIHVEVLSQTQKSLLVTQIAFPEAICDQVYATENYRDSHYISNTSDMVFRDSLERNMADSLTGDNENGFTLLKNITINT